jgi:protein-glutamine gamma-glutamyltransferase
MSQAEATLATSAARSTTRRRNWRAEWSLLPRETRDTLFQLGVIGWTVAPQLTHLPLWCSPLTALVLLWRAHLALRGAPLPGRWPVIGLLVIATGLTLWTERTLFGKEAGVTMLVVLMALKTLELRARRDALVVFFLGFFLVLTHCLYSQSLGTALWMMASAWGLMTAQVLANMPVGRPSVRQAGGIALRSALLGVPLMVVLFLLFPRIGPLWGLPQDALGKTGLSGSLRLGTMAEIANDDAIAFRVRFDGPTPPQGQLYFRGPVLSRFDGTDWRQAPQSRSGATDAAPDLRVVGAALPYHLMVEPIRLPLLPLLEATPQAPVLPGWELSATPDLQWRTDRLIGERVRVSARAWPRHALDPGTTLPDHRAQTLLPPNSNPRAQAWAQSLRARPEFAQADASALASALLQHLRNDGFVYTLAPGTYGRHPVDEFWFDRKLGFCEHFAASFVLMMRAMGVPARIVTGYQGAEPADADGWMVVRQSNAHAWAEYWQPGLGWRRVDPTSAVAPWRVENGRALAPRLGLVAGALDSMSPALAEQLRRAWELLDNRWNQWVMSYSRNRQFDLLQSLGVQAPDWQDLGLTLIGLLSAAALAGAGWAWWDRHRQDPWRRLHAELCDTLRMAGLDARMHHPPLTLAAMLRASHGDAAESAAADLESLDRLRYGPDNRRLPGPRWLRQFRRQVGRLHGRPALPRAR